MTQFVFKPKTEEKKAQATPTINPAFLPLPDLGTANSTPQTYDGPGQGEMLLKTAKATPSFLKGVAQGTAQDIATLPSVVSGKQDFTFTPKYAWEKAVFGAESFSAEQNAVDTGNFFGVPEEKSRQYGPLAIGALTVADFASFPGKRRAAMSLSDVAAELPDQVAIDTGRKFNQEPVFGLTTDAVVIDDGVSQIDEARVDQYLANIRNGDTVDPLEVFVDQNGSIVARDVNKAEAYRRAGEDFVDVVDRPQIMQEARFTPPDKPGLAPKAARVADPQERRFITGVKSVQPENTRLAGEYIPRSTTKLAEDARDLITKNPARAEKIALEGSDDFAVATASELLNKLTRQADEAAANGDQILRNQLYDKSAEIANEVAAKLTESGRAIQAASILSRLSPEGQIRFASRTIQDFNRKNPGKQIPELSGDQARIIADEVREIEKLTDPVEKARRFQEVQDGVKSLVPTPLFDKIAQVWKAGLLTGLKTQGLNIFSNASHFGMEIIKDVPAAAVDKAASLFTGKRYKTATVTGAFEGMKEGAINGKRYFMTGFDERNIGAKLDYKKVNFGTGKAAKFFQGYTDLVFRTLGTQDQIYYYSAAARSLMDQSLADGMNKGLRKADLKKHAEEMVQNPTEEMLQLSVYDAQTAVFQNKTGLGDAARYIQKWAPGGVPIGQFIIPFAQTPSAVAMQILRYSPAGAVGTIIKQARKGEFDQRAFSEAMGRSTIGLAPLAIGYALAESGQVALDYPAGDERQIELDKAEGVQYNSVKVGDEWRNPIILGPGGNLVLLGAHLQTAMAKAGSPSQAMSDAFFGTISSFSQQTFLTGFANFAAAIEDPKSEGQKYLQNITASFVPTIVSDVARSSDPSERQITATGPIDGTVERIKNRVPKARQTLEPQVTVFGEESGRRGNPLETMLDSSRPSEDRSNPMTSELRRLMEEGYRVSPTKLGNRNGYGVLSPEQNTKLWKLAGSITADKLSGLMLTQEYRTASDDERADAIKDFTKQSTDVARAAAVVEVTKDLEGEELQAKLSELKDGQLLTRDVFREYERLKAL